MKGKYVRGEERHVCQGRQAPGPDRRGGIHAWSGADQPELATEGLGCGLLVLRPLGFALPHYADSNKFGYVLSGSGVAGVLPVEAKERVVRLKAGDVIVVRTGDVSWWYNDNDGHADDLSILFIGDTARALSPGDISYSSEQAATAFRSQTAVLLTRLSTKLPGVCPREHDRKGLVVNAGHVAAGTLKTLTPSDLAALSGLGFSAMLGRLEPGAAHAVYVARGSARVQVSSAAGGDTLLLDEEVPAGSLFVVPRFAVALVAAGADGAEWVSLIKSGRPAVEHLTGEGLIFGGLTPQVVQASLKVAPELLKLL
ncbi:hypothetical protein VPH35_084989 [Triticum aestivum]